MKKYQFNYKGNLYECRGHDRDLQILNFNHCLTTQDWITLNNRITNQLMWFPNDLVIIPSSDVLTEKITKADVDIVKNVNDDKKRNTNFW